MGRKVVKEFKVWQIDADSIVYSNTQRRAINNLVHRAADEAEVARQVQVWFN